jgi:hypothetical protein
MPRQASAPATIVAQEMRRRAPLAISNVRNRYLLHLEVASAATRQTS